MMMMMMMMMVMGRYSEGSLFQRFPNPNSINPTKAKVGNLLNIEHLP